MKKMLSILKRFESIDSNHSDISDFDISDIDDDLGSGSSLNVAKSQPNVPLVLNDNEEDDDDELDSDDEPEDQGPDLATRLEGINLNESDKVWAQLTENEKKAFDSFALNAIIPPYIPWWEIKIEKKKIEVLNDDKSLIEQFPEIIKDIVPFDKLTSTKPSPIVSYNLINVLAAYTHTVRFFDNDHHFTPRQAATYFYRVCGNIKANLNINSNSDAFEQVYNFARVQGFQMDLHEITTMKNDVTSLIHGPYKDERSCYYILAALSDLHRLFVAAKLNQKVKEQSKTIGTFSHKYPDYEINDFDLISKGKCSIVIKKIEYYLAYSSSFWSTDIKL